jgi:hypothetical protein
MSNEIAKTNLDEELTLWQRFAEEGNTKHLPRGSEMLKFNGQEGIWCTPKSDPDSDLRGMELVADIRNLHHGWTRFEGNRVADSRIVRAPGRPARRAELGDTDKEMWELGLDGKTPKDPWNFAHYLPMFGREQGELYIYITSSSTGGREIKNLAAVYINKVREKGNPDRLPIVKLNREKFKSRFGSRLFVPILDTVGWRIIKPDFEAIAEPPERRKIEAPRKGEPQKAATAKAKEPAKHARQRDPDDDFDDEISL